MRAASLRRLAGMLATAAVMAAVPAAAHAEARGEYIVRLAPATSAEQGRALVRAAGGDVTRDVHLIHALGARLSPDAAHALAARPQVAAVQANAAVEPTGKASGTTDTTKTTTTTTTDPVKKDGQLDPSLLATAFNQSVKVEKNWLDSNYLATGKGVGVAVIDTGIAGDLVDFQASQSDSTSRVIASVVTNPNATTANDTYGHGTHVAGLIAGNGFNRAGTDALYGQYAGSAPHANLVSIKASDDAGDATVLDVIHGLQFAVDHKADYNIRVVNLSLNAAEAKSYKDDPLAAAVEAAWLQGLVVVTASGNRGTAADAVHYAPANDPFAIVVGGVDDKGTKDITDDALASWSSRGTTQDGLTKADIVAPGARLVSTLAPNSAFAMLCPTCVRSGQYIQAGGTSMAAAVASGVAATLLQAHPQWTPDQVKTAMVKTYRTIGSKGREIAADAAIKADINALSNVNAGAIPNPLVDPATGQIDHTRASWSRASWKSASDLLRASWSRASWSCDCSLLLDGSVDPTRASWRRASWSTAWDL